jgi:glucose/arabinose dehydrogenase
VAEAQALSPVFDVPQALRVHVGLAKIAEGIAEPTDIQFPPGVVNYAVVLQKGGIARWLRLDRGLHGELLRVEVLTASEQGLLGLAFHPRFADNGRFFLNCVQEVGGKHVSRVLEYHAERPRELAESKTQRIKIVLEVEQPYQNHNAGQLAFGPDGMLYIGWGDGGYRDDPEGHGQRPDTFKGSMLRIDVDRREGGKAYAIPPDNPFVGKDGFAPEVWAYGLRNPWRYTFDPRGRLNVADVGQDRWEEIDIVQAGDNLGWNVREGFACFREAPSECARADLTDPVHVYGREQGVSITGGYVYTGSSLPKLRGLYVFADFVAGNLFAIELPADRTRRVKRARSLGKWPLLISSFGRDAQGELYLTAFGRGEIFKLVPAGGPS